MEINRLIDHTNLKVNASKEDIVKLCNEAKQYEFMSVCVYPTFVSLAASLLKGSIVKVCTVIGFPSGATLPEVKKYEASACVSAGAEEIDMVINISKAKEHDYDYIRNEIAMVKEGCKGRLLKVILETCLLSDEEIKMCSLMALEAHADFVKTSTGFSTGGASEHAVKIMNEAVGGKLGIKASGGIHNFEEAMIMINAGATRLGASSGVAIMNSIKK